MMIRYAKGLGFSLTDIRKLLTVTEEIVTEAKKEDGLR